MATKKWRTSYTNHLIKVVMGEEPNVFAMYAGHRDDDAGAFLEYLVDYALSHDNLPGKSRVWKNVLVPKQGPVVDETEVDVLMLHEQGIFVLESKNYSGWIFGSENQRMWTQTLNRATKNKFYNPLMQNASHVRALAAAVDVPEERFFSYIVFSDHCELKDVPEEGERWRVCHKDDLLRLMRTQIRSSEPVFDADAFADLERRIDELSQSSTKEAREFHAQDVRMSQEGNVCPRCGGKLVERKGKYGAFLGCSNYPRCRFTRDVE